MSTSCSPLTSLAAGVTCRPATKKYQLIQPIAATLAASTVPSTIVIPTLLARTSKSVAGVDADGSGTLQGLPAWRVLDQWSSKNAPPTAGRRRVEARCENWPRALQ